MDRTGLLCGVKTGLECKEKEKSHGKNNHFLLVLVPVTQGSIVFFNFHIWTEEAIWRLKIAKEDCSENIPTIINGEMTCLYNPVLNNSILQNCKRTEAAVAVEKRAEEM